MLGAVLTLLVGLCVASATRATAAPSPQNGRIYFGTTLILPSFRDIPSGGRIYSVNPDGTDLRALTKGGKGRVTGAPAVSPDGTTVAFLSTGSGNDLALWLMDASGKHPRRVLSTPGTNYYSPSWAPDGQSLVMTSCDTSLGELDCPIVSVDADGTGVTTLLSNRRVNTTPSYSPDGTQLQYVSDRAGLLGALYVTTGSGSTQVTDASFEGVFSSWAPDGEHLLLNDHCCRPTSSIYTVRPDGSGLTRVVRTPKGTDNITPTYSPDGDQIAYASAQDDGVDLVIANTDGHRRTTIVDSVDAFQPSWAPRPGTGAVGPAPSVTPHTDIPTMASTPGAPGLSPTPTTDGRILYLDPDRRVLVTANPDGSASSEVTTTDEGFADHGTWTPDASRIVFAMLPDTPDRAQLFSVAPDGSDLQPILAEPAGVYDFDPEVTPDGQWVVFSRYDQERDAGTIWAVRLDGTGAHAVIPYATPSNPRFPRFHALSPDGTKLAYEVIGEKGTTDVIWLGAFDQRRARLLGAPSPITTPLQEAFSYSFSRDGQHVLGTHFNAHLGDGAYAFPIDGGTPLQIFQPPYPAQTFEPIQSPTGEKVAYTQEVEGLGGPWDLVIADRDGSDPQIIPTAADHPIHVQWSTAAFQPAGSAARAATASAAEEAASRQRLARLEAAVPAVVRETLRH